MGRSRLAGLTTVMPSMTRWTTQVGIWSRAGGSPSNGRGSSRTWSPWERRVRRLAARSGCRLSRVWPPGMHSSTLHGSLLDCAMAVADIVANREGKRIERVSEATGTVVKRLERFAGARVIGAQAAVPLSRPECQTRGGIATCLPEGGPAGLFGRSLTLVPPLIIDNRELRAALDRVLFLLEAQGFSQWSDFVGTLRNLVGPAPWRRVAVGRTAVEVDRVRGGCHALTATHAGRHPDSEEGFRGCAAIPHDSHVPGSAGIDFPGSLLKTWRRSIRCGGLDSGRFAFRRVRGAQAGSQSQERFRAAARYALPACRSSNRLDVLRRKRSTR